MGYKLPEIKPFQRSTFLLCEKQCSQLIEFLLKKNPNIHIHQLGSHCVPGNPLLWGNSTTTLLLVQRVMSPFLSSVRVKGEKNYLREGERALEKFLECSSHVLFPRVGMHKSHKGERISFPSYFMTTID